MTSSNEGSYQLLSLKAKGYGEEEPRLKVSYNIRNGKDPPARYSTSLYLVGQDFSGQFSA